MSNLARLPLSGFNLSSRCKNYGVRGMGSLPLLPLELGSHDDEPPMGMPEAMASLSFPPDTLTFSPKGENRLCSVVVLPWFTDAGPLRVL